MKRKIMSLTLASVMMLGGVSAFAQGEILINDPFINGYKDGTFKPDKKVTRAEIAKIAAEAYKIAQANEDFPDVESEHWAAMFIGGLQAQGIVEGDPDGNFRPEDGLTRAEFSAIVLRASGLKVSEEKADFSDTDGHWAEAIIRTLAENGIVKGYEDGTFKPQQEVTRAEAVAMVLRSIHRVPAKDIGDKVESPFSDVGSDAWYFRDVLAASTNYSYKVTDEGEVIIGSGSEDESDVFEVKSVIIPNQTIKATQSDRAVKIRINGESEDADLDILKAKGFKVKFTQIVEGENKTPIIFASGQADSEDGVIAGGAPEGTYKIKVAITDKNDKVAAQTEGEVTVEGLNAETIKEIKSVKFMSEDGRIIEDGQINRKEKAVLYSLTVDTEDVKDFEVSAENLDITIGSSNPSVVSVNGKEITGEKNGTSNITVNMGDLNITQKFTVTDFKIETMEVVNQVIKVNGRNRTVKVKINGLDENKSSKMLEKYGLVLNVKDIVKGNELTDQDYYSIMASNEGGKIKDAAPVGKREVAARVYSASDKNAEPLASAKGTVEVEKDDIALNSVLIDKTTGVQVDSVKLGVTGLFYVAEKDGDNIINIADIKEIVSADEKEGLSYTLKDGEYAKYIELVGKKEGDYTLKITDTEDNTKEIKISVVK